MKHIETEIVVDITPNELMEIAKEFSEGVQGIQSDTLEQKQAMLKNGDYVVITWECSDTPLKLSFRWLPRFDENWNPVF